MHLLDNNATCALEKEAKTRMTPLYIHESISIVPLVMFGAIVSTSRFVGAVSLWETLFLAIGREGGNMANDLLDSAYIKGRSVRC